MNMNGVFSQRAATKVVDYIRAIYFIPDKSSREVSPMAIPVPEMSFIRPATKHSRTVLGYIG